MQVPHHPHRHPQNNRIGNNIRDLQTVIKLRQIDTPARDGGFPEFPEGDAGDCSDETDAETPEDDDCAHGVDGEDHGADGEEAAVELKDGEFDKGYAEGVEEAAACEGLDFYISCRFGWLFGLFGTRGVDG